MDSLHPRHLLVLLLVTLLPALAWGQGVLCGDCNLDGPVTILDALTAAQMAASILSIGTLQQCVCDVNGDTNVTVLDALMMAQDAAGLGVVLWCPGGACGNDPPTVDITAPLGGTQWGVITIFFDIWDPDMDPQTVTCEYSLDGGITWSLASTAGTGGMSTNPASGITPALNITFDWTSQADLPPALLSVDLRVTTDDGLATDSDVASFLVDNALPPPYCTIVTPAPGVPAGNIAFDWRGVDVTSTPVDLLVTFSVDGGHSWEQATEGPGSHGTTGLSTSPAPGTPHVFVWTSAFDGVGLGTPQWTILEIMVQNATGWSICATAQFLVQN